MDSILQKAPILAEIAKSITIVDEIDIVTIHQAKRVVADTIGVAFSGIQTSAFKIAFDSRNPLFGDGIFPIWGIDQTTSLSGAVFYNALSVSSTDFDEGHRKAVGHPASLVVPTALIVGKHLQKSLTEILKSVVVGYEIGTRFSHARIKEKIITYSTGRWGAIASAATAAHLLGLSVEKTMHALSLAAILSPAMLGGSTDVSTGSMSKEGVAWAAQAGLQSALLAKNGFIGPYLFLDEHDDYDTTLLLEGLGKNRLINSNYFKPYSCCRWLHPGIQATLELKQENGIDLLEIKKIEVGIFARALDLISSKYPKNDIQAQFHLPYVIAIALLFEKITPNFFSENYLNDSKVRQLIGKTSLVAVPEYSSIFPSQLPTGITLSLKNGKTFSKEIRVSPWDADCQPTDEQLYRKMVDQGGDQAIEFWDTLFIPQP